MLRVFSSESTRLVTALRMRARTGVACSISRDTLSGRSSVSTTPCTKRSHGGNSLASSVMNIRRTCSRTLLSRSPSTGSNGRAPGTNSSAEYSTVPSARQCSVAHGVSKACARWRYNVLYASSLTSDFGLRHSAVPSFAGTSAPSRTITIGSVMPSAHLRTIACSRYGSRNSSASALACSTMVVPGVARSAGAMV